MTARRLERGGVVDRDSILSFTLDGEQLTGCAGDTVASAALAASRMRVGDSIYRSRPRGIYSAGVEEPNAFVRSHGEHDESMLSATTLELADGMDLSWENGIGRLDQDPDPAENDHRHVHTDVAVIGAGPAGLAAARAAVRSGAGRVTLLEQDHALGGSLLRHPDDEIDGIPATAWIAHVRAELEAAGARILTRTSVFGSYDSNYLLALEKREQHSRQGHVRLGHARQRVWHLTAGRVVLATGAFERTLAVANNDLPGVMLASAAATYLGRYGILAGRQPVVLTTNDSGHAVARDLAAAGAEVTVVDVRNSVGDDVPALPGMRVLRGDVVLAALGTSAVTGVRIRPLDGGPSMELPADLLAIAGGFTPNLALHSQRQGAMAWDEDLAGFVPTVPVRDQALAGSVLGTTSIANCLAEGAAAGAGEPLPTGAEQRRIEAGETAAVWLVREDEEAPLDQHFVDLQRDSTAADVQRAVGAGMHAIEHVKRYTSISTGLDQGRIGGGLTVGVLTELLAEQHVAMLPTTSRAPFTPVAFGALAGRRRGELYDPARRTPTHDRALAAGAVWEDAGQWKRARYFPREGEDMDAAVGRECRAARTGVACMDGSTLGKISFRGTDTAEFLNRLYTTGFAKLAVGKQRYGIMCTPDGMVLDDGVVFRLAEDEFLATTTTGGAAKVLEWLEEWHQTEWPDLDVTFTSVTEQLATITVVGPLSRGVIARLAPELDVSRDGFGFMELRETTLASGIPARICRLTFSGELAFEVNVPTWYGEAVWDQVMAAGAEHDITPYGTETMHVLRAEKAFPIVGQDTDGTVTPQDLGMGSLISRHKDFLGKRSYARAGHTEQGRKQLVALLPEDRELLLPEGAQVIEVEHAPAQSFTGASPELIPMIGQVTSSYRSEAIGGTFGLALVRDGRDRIGGRVMAAFGGRFVPARVHEPVLYDPEGERRDG